MRIVFMGTPDFAVVSLKALLQAGHTVTAVFTQPDKPKGRGNKVQFPPVKEAALAAGIEVFQPQTLRDEAVLALLRSHAPDVIVVAAYGKLLPPAVLELPPLGCINVHGSLLPKYRGAAPIQRAVLNGEAESGVTTMLMAQGMDTGDMLLTSTRAIPPDMTSGELFDLLAEDGAALLLQTLEQWAAGKIQPRPQCHEQATHAPMLSKEEAPLCWDKAAKTLHDQVRGLNPAPIARTVIAGIATKVYRSAVGEKAEAPAGTVVSTKPLAVACGDGYTLQLLELQPEGGKRMEAQAFLCGHPLQCGQLLCEK